MGISNASGMLIDSDIRLTFNELPSRVYETSRLEGRL